MGKIIDALRKLGTKLTGKSTIDSNSIATVLNDIADDYEGGGGTAEVIVIDVSDTSKVEEAYTNGIKAYDSNILPIIKDEDGVLHSSDSISKEYYLPLSSDFITITSGGATIRIYAPTSGYNIQIEGNFEKHLYQYDIDFAISHQAFDADEYVLIRLFSNEQLTLTQNNFVDYLLQNYTNKLLVCHGNGYNENQDTVEYQGITVKNIDGALSFDFTGGNVGRTGKLSDTPNSLDVSEIQIF